MDKIELVQYIGNEVCEDCGPNSDCGEIPSDCSRIENALKLLDKYFSNQPVEQTGSTVSPENKP